MEEENLNNDSIKSADKETKIKKPRKKSTVKKQEEEIVENTSIESIEQEIPIKSQKRSFELVDFNKEYEWTLTEEIELDSPMKFIFTLATNLELAQYQDKLICYEGNIVITYQNLVDIEILNSKVIRIENIELDGEIKTITDLNIIKEIVDKVLDLNIINELSGYIRVMSNCKGKLY